MPGVVAVGLVESALRSCAARMASLMLCGCEGGLEVVLPFSLEVGGIGGSRDEAISRGTGGCVLFLWVVLGGVTQNM